MGIDGPAGTLPDEEPVLFPRDENHEPPFLGRRAWRSHGELSEAIFAEGKTELAHGTYGTSHLARRADEGAQLHQGLVQVRTARGVNRNQIPGQLPQGCVGLFVTGIAFDAENPAYHTNDVPVQNRRRLVEGDAADGPGGVSSNAGQRKNVIEISRKPPAMPPHDDLGGGVRVSDAAVIAQTLPQFEDLLRSRPREGG